MTEIYPLTIVADRYGGTYSDARFTAWNLEFDEIPREIAEDDVSCANFWFNDSSEYVVGKGASPQLALIDLEQKLSNVDQDIVINVLEKCETCNGKGEELHVCPYKEDIDGDSNTLCNCCESCTHNCTMSI